MSGLQIYTVSLFGHRRMADVQPVISDLLLTVRGVLRANSYVRFLLGRNGDFDVLAASILKGLQREVGKENCEIVLVLPYSVADISDYESYYDNIVIPDCVFGIHPKKAIWTRNRWMIEHSDLVIAAVERAGGADAAMTYAIRKHKKVINLLNS